MLRLLFLNTDNSKQLTVVTDGIDGQLNVFTTENVRGDKEWFESLGIVLRAGMTYNVNQLKEWAIKNSLSLVAYPEGLNDKEQTLVSLNEEWVYTLVATPPVLYFPKEGGTLSFAVQSDKIKFIGGEPVGTDIEVGYVATVVKNGEIFKQSASNPLSVTVAANTGAARTGEIVIIQDEESEGGLSTTVSLEQAAGGNDDRPVIE